MKANTAKYLSYAEAWRRIKSANEREFYFEVVTLCESIISDRLLSYLLGVDPRRPIQLKTPFAVLIAQWRKSYPKQISSGKDVPDLIAAVDKWREDRNMVVHGLMKSSPGAPTVPVVPFIEHARETANKGAKLARAVSNWHKKELTAHSRTMGRKG